VRDGVSRPFLAEAFVGSLRGVAWAAGEISRRGPPTAVQHLRADYFSANRSRTKRDILMLPGCVRSSGDRWVL